MNKQEAVVLLNRSYNAPSATKYPVDGLWQCKWVIDGNWREQVGSLDECINVARIFLQIQIDNFRTQFSSVEEIRAFCRDYGNARGDWNPHNFREQVYVPRSGWLIQYLRRSL